MGEKDSISRQAAIDTLCDNCDNPQAVCAHYPCKQYTSIETLPSAQPERKKGKWHQRFYPQIEMMVCSECNNEFSYDAETGVRDYNFCPNCGADMRG